jgi:hypothetical protein
MAIETIIVGLIIACVIGVRFPGFFERAARM